MEQEFKAIIEKNLPAQVGEVLKKRLEQAEADAAKVESLSKEVFALQRSIRTLEEQLSDYGKFDARNKEIEARENACDTKERDLKVATLEYQLESEKDKTNFSKQVALGLVRNTEYKRTVFDSKNGPNGVDQYNNPIYATHTTNADEVKKAE